MSIKFVNQVNFPILADVNHKVEVKLFPEVHSKAFIVEDLIPERERKIIFDSLSKANWLPVSVTGMSGNYVPGDEIGSYRASNYSPEYADVLWGRICEAFPRERVFTDEDPTDWDDHQVWEPVGVSPLLRFIRYENGGWLVAHYDAPYIQDDNVRTLSSLVIYLDADENIQGGATRYMFDPEPGVLLKDRDLSDWDRGALDEEVRYRLIPEAGTGVVFDHRLFHDAEKVIGVGHKTIIRTDILYRKVLL